MEDPLVRKDCRLAEPGSFRKEASVFWVKAAPAGLLLPAFERMAIAFERSRQERQGAVAFLGWALISVRLLRVLVCL